MDELKKSDSDNLKNALCYIPFVALVLMFVETNKTDGLQKHIKYWAFLLGGYIVWQVILSVIWLGHIIFLFYMILSGFLFYKAYQWEDVNLEHIDKLEKKVQDEFGSSKK